MSNPWLLHVKEYRLKHPEVSYSQALSEASKTYSKKGSGLSGGAKPLNQRSVKNLQKIMRKYKKANCPPYANKKKADLVNLINSLNIQVVKSKKKKAPAKKKGAKKKGAKKSGKK